MAEASATLEEFRSQWLADIGKSSGNNQRSGQSQRTASKRQYPTPTAVSTSRNTRAGPKITNNAAHASSSRKSEENEDCVICMDVLNDGKLIVETLSKCSHKFHKNCIDEWFNKTNPQCPICKTMYGTPKGTQPAGRMSRAVQRGAIPGFNCKDIITIQYSFPDGVQSENHPNPGQRYHGTQRSAYLPNNNEGRRVADLLQLAFDHSLVFTVGTSATTGRENCVIWNGIHHKTSLHGGSTAFGYPDDHYLTRVQHELAAVGITEDLLATSSRR